MSNTLSKEKFQIALDNLKYEITQRGDLSYISVKDQLKYVDELLQFPLGKILLEKKFIDTFWTDFITTHFDQNKRSNNLENFVLNRSPFTLAWRELLRNFQKVAQENVRDEMSMASIPCGTMRELLELDYSSLSNFTIIGIDIDADSLLLAKKLAEKKNLSQHLKLLQNDAWQLPFTSEIDLITSCGLNIYVSDRQKALGLYRQFLKALKLGGRLIIGFLTYPPDEKMPSEWLLDEIPPEDLLLEKVLYKDILNVHWRNFRTSNEFENDLKEVGFSEVYFYYDTLRVFPTVVAKK
jgi:SAM-dependent methyltransferase